MRTPEGLDEWVCLLAVFWFLVTVLVKGSWLTGDYFYFFCAYLILCKAAFSEMALAGGDVSVDAN